MTMNDIPTSLTLDPLLKPVSWDVMMIGSHAHLVYDIFLSHNFEWENHQDPGDYLMERGLATPLTELDSMDDLKNMEPIWLVS